LRACASQLLQPVGQREQATNLRLGAVHVFASPVKPPTQSVDIQIVFKDADFNQ
jgi:hypothetical protein